VTLLSAPIITTGTARRLYVISSEERGAPSGHCRRARNQRLAQAAEELNDLLREGGKGKLKTREAVQENLCRLLGVPLPEFA
jgi:hypothetical protein